MEQRRHSWEAFASQPQDLSHDRAEEGSEEIGTAYSAFGETYQEYLPPIYRYLRARAAHAEDAADLTQQVFLHAWEALPHYQDRGLPVIAWLFRIARNVATDYHRRRQSTVAWDLLPETLHPMQQEAVDKAMLQHEAAERLRTLLLHLDPDERELLLLRFVTGLTLQEIGLIVSKSESGVQKQLVRILHRLKEQYRDE